MADDANLLSPLPAGAGRREQTKTANRESILEAAREVFAEMGFEAATVRDIIRRTSLSVGAFYNYFRSKEEVFQALADDGAERFRPILRAEYEKAQDFESFVRGALFAYFSFMADEHESWQLRRPPGEPMVRIAHSDSPARVAVFEEVRTALGGVIERGLAPPVDLDLLTVACIGIAQNVCELMLEQRRIDVETATDFSLRLILGGLPALPRTDQRRP